MVFCIFDNTKHGHMVNVILLCSILFGAYWYQVNGIAVLHAVFIVTSLVKTSTAPIAHLLTRVKSRSPSSTCQVRLFLTPVPVGIVAFLLNFVCLFGV